jgi:large subunit ribosomal protein L21
MAPVPGEAKREDVDMRYAIVASGGKQYVAREGQTLEVDRLGQASGQSVEFKDVLLAADGGQVMVGRPSVDGARVTGTVEREVRGEKIVVFRYQPKKRRRRKLGHRQTYTRVRIDRIEVPGLERSADEPAPKRPPARSRPAKPAPSRAAPAKAAPRKPAASKPAAGKPAPSKASKKKG